VALDWAAAIALGWPDISITGYDSPGTTEEVFFRPAKVVGTETMCESGERWKPSSNWTQGGLIIQRLNGFHLKQWLESPPESSWEAHIHNYDGDWIQFGPTPLVAAMRCYVASKLGDEVEVPRKLVTTGVPAPSDDTAARGRRSNAAHDQPSGVLKVTGEELARQAITMLADLRAGYQWDDLHRDFAGLVDEAQAIGIDLSEVEGLPATASGPPQVP
jgi:hypothetical protein